MKYVELLMPDGRTRLYRFRHNGSAEAFVEERPASRRPVRQVDAKPKYPIYDGSAWMLDEYGFSYCEPKKWWRKRGFVT